MRCPFKKNIWVKPPPPFFLVVAAPDLKGVGAKTDIRQSDFYRVFCFSYDSLFSLNDGKTSSLVFILIFLICSKSLLNLIFKT